MKKEKLINWDQEDWHYLIEKAFKLNSMTIKELKDFKTELKEGN